VAQTITVNKSLAVVLGVGPLLAINVLYTVFFYTANILTGSAWLMIVPLVCAAFLFSYAHKYTWDRLASAKKFHISLGVVATLLFLAIPLIFLANINLMLFPERWFQVHGFLSAVVLPNVLPRYLHFVLACVAVTALFLLAYFNRKGYPTETRFQELDRAKIRKIFYGLALGASGGQLFVGPLVLVTLPDAGMSWQLLVVIGIGAALGIGAMVLMGREIFSPTSSFPRRFVVVVVLITGTAFFMGYGRHLYRERAVREHRHLMAEHTREFAWASAGAQWRLARGLPAEQEPLGQRIFKGTCKSCHALDRVLVGPAIREIAQLYAGDPEGIVRWTKDPGKKREGFPTMPAFRLEERKLQAVAEYLLQLGGTEGPELPATEEPRTPDRTG
jgi:cytochrome c